MKTLGVLLALAGAALVLMAPPPPAEAYDIFLTQWNQAEAEAANDQVKVTVSGSTITFLWVDGNGIAPTATNLNKLFWSATVVAQGGSNGTGSGDYAGVADCGGCTADGFGKYQVSVDDSDNSTTTIGPISFTFSNPFSTTTLLTPSDFALQVQYSVSGCGGFVDGKNVDTTPNSACAPVPEPITMFLGGTGLLALGYAARKRLFGARLESAS